MIYVSNLGVGGWGGPRGGLNSKLVEHKEELFIYPPTIYHVERRCERVRKNESFKMEDVMGKIHFVLKAKIEKQESV